MIYILVSINIHIGNGTNKGHYVCDILEYNTGTCWNCDDTTMTKYSVYPKNVYDNLSTDNEQKEGKHVILDGSDSIVSMLYIKIDIIALMTYYFIK